MRKESKTIKIGGFSHIKPVFIGGKHPVAIQTMWKEKLSIADLKTNSAVERIEKLGKMGCALLRFAAVDLESAEVLGRLAEKTDMPLCADIHFDHKIALKCMDFPIAKIRINPGNIGAKGKVKELIQKAAEKNIAIRIGVNAGSLPLDLRKRVQEGMKTSEALALAAKREASVFDDLGFGNYLISMKASTIADTIEANKILASVTDAPLHIGVTEAGPLIAGVTANTAAIVTLLCEGIGDTIRVSLSDTMESELIAAREIIGASRQLALLNGRSCERLKRAGIKIVSCPRCARAGFDTHGFAEKWSPALYAMETDLTVAVMGCEVNGPEEAKHADLGITGAGDKVLIFKRGKIIRTLAAQEADKIFEEELQKI